MAFLRKSRKSFFSVQSHLGRFVNLERKFPVEKDPFSVQGIIRNASMKYSARFTAITRVTRCDVFKDRNADVLISSA